LSYRDAVKLARKKAEETDFKVVFYVYYDPDEPRKLRVGDGYKIEQEAIDDKDIVATSHD